MPQTGIVLRIEHASIYDGEGIRSVVFLQGCPLACQWCSTPESQSYTPHTACDKVYGRAMTVEQVFAEIQKDELFFFHSGGGVTFSGGEPLLQADFMREVLLRCRRLGIGTAIETSLYAQWSTVAPLLELLDLIYVDLKVLDADDHLRLTGVDNALILDNIRRLDAGINSKRLILRTPIIPGINDSERQLSAAARFCGELQRLNYWELLPYHRLGIDTYAKLGRSYALPQIKTPDREYMQARAAMIQTAAPNLKLSVR